MLRACLRAEECLYQQVCRPIAILPTKPTTPGPRKTWPFRIVSVTLLLNSEIPLTPGLRYAKTRPTTHH